MNAVMLLPYPVGDGINCLFREPDAGNLHVRFDERDVETERCSRSRQVSALPCALPSLGKVRRAASHSINPADYTRLF
jgi:hypothetical protein